jgi:hypothetical protein
VATKQKEKHSEFRAIFDITRTSVTRYITAFLCRSIISILLVYLVSLCSTCYSDYLHTSGSIIDIMSLMRFCRRFPGEYRASRQGCVLPPLPRPSPFLARALSFFSVAARPGLIFYFSRSSRLAPPRREENDGLGKSSEERKEREEKRRG